MAQWNPLNFALENSGGDFTEYEAKFVQGSYFEITEYDVCDDNEEYYITVYHRDQDNEFILEFANDFETIEEAKEACQEEARRILRPYLESYNG